MALGKLDELQSDRILPLARAIVAITALITLLVVAGAAVWIVLVQLPVWLPVHEEAVPSLPTPPAVERSALDPEEVARRLMPPSDVTVAPFASMTSATKVGTTVARVDFKTTNGFAGLPDGLVILSSRDAPYFRPAMATVNLVGLAVTEALVDEVRSELGTLREARTREFHLRLAVRDRYGLTSKPTEVKFSLSLQPDKQQEAAVAPASAPMSEVPLSQLQQLAQQIALAIDPARTPAYFDAYKRVLQVPDQCGAAVQHERFAVEARPAFELVKQQLASVNPEAFYLGLCDAWKAAQAKEDADRARISAEQQRAANARQAIINRNAQARSEAAGSQFAAWAQQRIAFTVIGGALTVFLFVSLILAFFAIESHSKAIRAAMEAMAAKEGKAGEA